MTNREVLLIIEDELAPTVLAQETLGDEWEIFTADNGHQGIELFKSLFRDGKKPKLVLVDIMMPGIDGFLVAQTIRELDSEVIILLWSVAVDQINIAHKAKCSGANDILDKQGSSPTMLKRQIDLCLKKIREEKLVIREDKELKFRNLEMAFSAINVGIIQTDDSENITLANQAFRKISGYDTEQLNNMSVFNFIAEEDHPFLIAQVSSRKSGVTNRYEIRLKTKDGHVKTVGINSVPMFDNDTNFIGATAIITDLTLQKTVENSLFQREQELKNQVIERTLMLSKEATFWNEILNSIPGIFFVTDLKFRILKANRAARKSAGTNNVIGKSAFTTIYGKKLMGSQIEALLEGKKSKYSFEVERKDGKIFEVNLYISRHEENSECIIHIFNDITLHKQAEKLMKNAKILAELANSSKGNFLATMSHEIRTPMNAIIGFNNILLESELDEYQKEYAENVKKAAEGLLIIINDILDFSKIEEGKMTLDSYPFSLDEILESVAYLTNHRIREKDIELVMDLECCVHRNLKGDAQRLLQILTNLTGNAAKFTEKGEIAITAKTKNETRSLVNLEFSIRDTGIGISHEHLTSLFELFHQADSSISRRYGGTGLGLAISKRLTEMMGGTISVESTLDVGSTFTFDVVLEKDSNADAQEMVIPEFLQKINILVKEENERVHKIVSRILDSNSFNYSSKNTGESFLMELNKASQQKNPYHLLLFSLKGPSDESLNVLYEIRKNKNFNSTKIIILIPKYPVRKKYEDIIEEYQIDGVVTKPVTKTALINCIKKAFGLHVSRPQKGNTEKPKKEDLEGIAGAHVLLVEDLEVNSQLITTLLQKIPIQVTEAKNGKEAVDMMKTPFARPLELILMDVHMPVMNGLEATQIIRNIEENREIPIIALTASAMSGDKEKCLHAGMNDFLSKPIDANHLLQKLIKWLPAKERKPLAVIPNKLDFVQTPIPNIKGISVDNALNHTGGDTELYKKLLHTFFDSNFTELIASMQNMIIDGDVAQVKKEAHKLKGAANNIGALNLARIASKIENGDLSKKMMIQKITQLEIELLEVLEGIESNYHFSKPGYNSMDNNSGVRDDAFLRDKFNELKSSLEMHDIKSEQLFDELMPELLNKEYRTLYQEIENFNYQDALAEILRIADFINLNGDKKNAPNLDC